MSKESAYFKMDADNGRYDIKKIKKSLDTLHGVISVSASPYDPKVAVDFDNSGVSRDEIQEKLEHMGFTILSSDDKILRM